jgi:DNA-binding LacI/PurR family transcriptional regulator
MARRVTMSDIADRAGVSRVAVSYALNGRPGVSAQLRARILRIAEEIGFSANTTALALKGALAQTIGLALRTPAPGQGVSGYHRSLISGLQAEISVRGFGLALQFAADHREELALYRRWHAEQRVDGVVVTDLTTDDPRPAEVADLQLPAVLVGDLAAAEPGPARIGMDESAPALAVAGHLADRDHRAVVHVAGPEGLRETARRVAAFAAACDRHALARSVLHTDQTGAAAAQATRRVLSSTQRPAALVYDTDVMAVAGLGVAMEMRVPVPTGVALVSWEDSALCQLVRPALTALRRDVTGYGAGAARLLLAAIDDGTAGALRFPPATLHTRAST